jgi:uncharacterized protein YceH (UPF0502 family)
MGFKEPRHAHLLSGTPDTVHPEAPPDAQTATEVALTDNDVVARLTQEVAELRRELGDLRAQFAELKKQLE